MIELQSVSKLQNKSSSINVQQYYCISKKPAFRVCTNQDCTSPSICCKDYDCECNQNHIDCAQINLQNLIKKINNKVVDTTEIINHVTERFDKIIDMISQIYEEIHKIVKRYGLRQEEITFLRCLEDNCENKLTGEVVYNANKIAKEKYKGDFNQIQRCIDTLWCQMQGTFWGTLYSMKDLYEMPLNRDGLTKNCGENFLQQLLDQMKESFKGIQPKRMKINRKLKEQQKEQIKNQEKESGILNQINSEEKDQKKQISENQILGSNQQVDVQGQENDSEQIDDLEQKLMTKLENKLTSQKQQLKRETPSSLLKQETVKSQKSENQKSQDKKQPQKSRISKSPRGLLTYFSLFQRPFIINNNRDQKFKQACKTLCEVCDIKEEQAEKFILQNCYDSKGRLSDTEEILNIWWNKQNP